VTAGRLGACSEIAESRDPVSTIVDCLEQPRIGNAGPGESLDLHGAAQFFDTSRTDRPGAGRSGP